MSLQVVLLCMLVALPAAVELGLAIAPSATLYILYGAVAVGLLWLAHDCRNTRRLRASAAMLVAALVCLHLVPWNARKSFLHRFEQIRPGMQVQQVDQLLGGYSFGAATAADGTVERRYAHSRAGRFDSDWGIVRLRQGLVVDTKFLPD